MYAREGGLGVGGFKSPVDEEEIKIKMDDGVARFFTRFGGNLFVDLWEAQLCLGDPNEIVVS